MDELLQRPGSLEQEREKEEERKEKEAFKDYDKKMLKIRMKKAQIEAETEHLRKSNEDWKSCLEVNNKRRREFEENLKKEDIKNVIEEMKEFPMSSSRHQEFHSGYLENYNKLHFKNFSHLISQAQGDEIRRQLQVVFKLYSGKDEEFLECVLVPDCIVLLWAQAQQLSKADAEKQLESTFADIEISSPSSDEAAKVAKEEEQRRKKVRQKRAKKAKELKKKKWRSTSI